MVMKKLVYLLPLQIALSSSIDLKAMEPVEQDNPFRKLGGDLTRQIMQNCRDNDLLNLSMADKWTRQAFLGLFEQKLKEDTRGRQVLNEESVIITGKRKRNKPNSENEQKKHQGLNFNSIEIAFNEGNPFVIFLVAKYFPNMSPGQLDKKLGLVARGHKKKKEQAYAAYLRAVLHLNDRCLGLKDIKLRDLGLASSEMFDISQDDLSSLRGALNPDFGFDARFRAEASYFIAKSLCLSDQAQSEDVKRHFNELTQALPYLDFLERIDANLLRCILRFKNSVDDNCMSESEFERVSGETLHECLNILESDTYTFNNKTRVFFILANFLRFTASHCDDDIWMPILEEVIKHENNDKRKSKTTTRSLDFLKRFLLMTYPEDRPNPKYNELLLNEDRFFYERLGKRFKVLVQSVGDGNTVSDSFRSEVENLKTYFKVGHYILPKVNLSVLLLQKAKTNNELKNILREFREIFDTNSKDETRGFKTSKIESLLNQVYDDVQNNNNDKRDAEEPLQDKRSLKQIKWEIIKEKEGDGPWDFAMEPSNAQDENMQDGNQDAFGIDGGPSFDFSFDEDSLNYGG